MSKFDKIFGVNTKSLILAGILLFASSCSMFSGSEGDQDDLSDEDISLSESDSSRFGDGNIPNAKSGGMFDDVQFSYDSYSVESSETGTLEQVAEKLKSTKSLKVELEGHCDKRGTAEYNLALGDKRAKAVAKYLVGLGVSASQLSTVSYGEEIPLDSKDSEDAYAKNRRVHFAVVRQAE